MKTRVAATWGGIAVIVAGGATYYYAAARPAGVPTVVTVAVSRGDVIATVDATGTLQAVTTVQVGTQVSGTIKALHADFNSRVRRNEVIAELEPSLFRAQVEQARASLVRLQAEAVRASVQREDAQRKLQRARDLAARQLIAAADLEAAEMTARQADAAMQSAEAQIVQARASLNQSEVNLAHTVINAPIDGIVISRNVDVGQTVAASMQAPTLFVIARDLAAMQVNASVAESDIGRVRPGQPVSFHVDAYPGEVFTGEVAQVRLEPLIQQNVVSYITTIGVKNADLKLRPGMTANVTIEIARASGVLRVPNAALRIRPSADVLAALGVRSDPSAAAPAARGTTGTHQEPVPPDSRYVEIWLARDGRLERVSVLAGTTDGRQTAVAGAVTEGAAVVTGLVVPAASASTPDRSPLLPFGNRPAGSGRGSTARPSGT